MPRGKKTVYAGLCSVCKMRTCTRRILKAKKADFPKIEVYCSACCERTPVKLTEEKHG